MLLNSESDYKQISSTKIIRLVDFVIEFLEVLDFRTRISLY